MSARKIVRNVLSFLAALFLVVLYFNVENLASRLGWANLLADAIAPEAGHRSPVLALIQHPIMVAASFLGIGIAVGVWVDTLLTKLERNERADPPHLEALSSEQNAEIDEKNTVINGLQARIDQIEEAGRRKKEIVAELARMEEADRMVRNLIPAALQYADKVQRLFEVTQQKIDAASGYELESARRGPIRELEYALHEWYNALTGFMPAPIPDLDPNKLLDFSDYSRDPLRPGRNEPPGMSGELQGMYRKFAIQADNLRLLQAQLPTMIREERERLQDALDAL